MKIGKFLLAGLIALGFMACNNDEAPVVNNAEATVSVKVMPSSGPAVRAVGDLTDPGIEPTGLGAESAIKKTQVWIFVGNTLDGYGESNTNEVTNVAASVGSRDIIVVVNGTDLTGSSTKADILAYQQSVPVDIATNGLLMTAEPLNAALVPGKNTIGYGANPTNATSLEDATLKVARVNARVAIVDAKLGTLASGQELIFDALTDVDVAIFNVAKKTKIFGAAATLATNTDYLFGEAWPSTSGSYTVGTAAADFKNAVSFPIAVNAAPYYYVTENTATDVKEQMLIVLRGKPTLDGDPVVADGLYTDEDGYTYYPVWVNADLPGYNYVGDDVKDSIIRRNTQYNISLTITKIGNPTIDPVEEAFLDVKVEVLPWEVVDQNVEW